MRAHDTFVGQSDPAPSASAPEPADGSRLVSRFRARGFRGEVLHGAEDLGRYAGDYGRRVRARPRLAVLPRDTADAQRAFAAAAETGLRLRLRGEGNALAGQSQTEGGLIVATRELRLPSGAQFEIDASNRGPPTVRLSTGLSWGEATMRLAEAGYRLTVAVLCKEPSVGGTLSVGGIGLGSHAFGAQIDTVIDAEIVTPDARIVSTSSWATGSSMHPVLGGQGQFGLITAVTLPLVPIGESLQLDRHAFDDFRGFATAIRDVAAHGTEILGLWGVVNRIRKTGRLQYQVNVVREPTSPRPVPSATAEAAQTLFIPWSAFARYTPEDWQPSRFPAWAEITFGSIDDMVAFVGRHPELLEDLRPGDIVSCIPVRRRPLSGATLARWPEVPEGCLMASLGLFSFRDAQASAERLSNRQHALHADAARSVGATNYAISCLPRSSREWDNHFGTRRGAVAEARKSFDPNGLIAPLPFLEEH